MLPEGDRGTRQVDRPAVLFTQEDPIGLAGGLNLYGYGAGDPINNSDPFGLCPIDKPLCQWLKATLVLAGTDIGMIAGGGAGLAGLAGGPAVAATVPAGAIAGAAIGATVGAALGGVVDVMFSEGSSQSGIGGAESQPTSVNQMNQQVQRGQAPRNVIRVDRGKVKGEQDNVHFKGGHSLNRDGTWKHGGRDLTSTEGEWLVKGGFKTPQ